MYILNFRHISLTPPIYSYFPTNFYFTFTMGYASRKVLGTKNEKRAYETRILFKIKFLLRRQDSILIIRVSSIYCPDKGTCIIWLQFYTCEVT